MRRVLKWLLYGVLGFVGLIVVIAVIGAVVGGGGGGTDQAVKQAEKRVDEAAKEQQKPGGPQDYLNVTGTQGISFSCSIMHGDMRQTSIDGGAPQKIKLQAMDEFGAVTENVCQKSGAKGTLEVTLYVGGEQQASNQTSAQYGVVTVGYPQ